MSRLALRNLFLMFGSALAALGCALAAYRWLHGAQTYPQFVVGSLAWTAESKRGELAAALAFIVALPAAWFSLQRTGRHYASTRDDDGLAALQLACVPGAIWLGHAVFFPAYGLGWLFLSAVLLAWWAAGALGTATASRGRPTGSAAARPLPALNFMLTPVLAGFSAVGILYCLNRALLFALPVPAFLIGFGCAAAALLFAVWRSGRTAPSPPLDWRKALMLSQLGIPLLALGLIPTPVLHGSTLVHEPSISSGLVIVCVLVAALALRDIVRCYSRNSRGDLMSSVSPVALLLCLWIIRSPDTGIPVVPTDDWHFGELLLPWISWRDFGLVPFADVMPVRGFVSVLDAALSDLLMTASASGMTHMRPALALAYSALVFFAMRYAAGTVAALLAVAVLDFASPIARVDYLFAAGVGLQAGLALRGRYPHTALAWLFTSLLLFVLAPGQGVLYAAATSPLMFHAMWNANRSTRIGVASATLVALIALTAAVASVPIFSRIATGIALYFADNVTINTAANGISWASSFRMRSGLTPLVLDGLRSFCLLAAALAAVAALNRYRTPALAEPDSTRANGWARLNQVEIALGAVLVLTVVTFLPRVLGRIDSESASRIGMLTLLVLGALVPLAMARGYDVATRSAAAVFALLIASALHVVPGTPHEGSAMLSSDALLVPKQHNEPAGAIDASDAGLDNIGIAAFDPAHLRRLRELRALLDEMLPRGLPYYDFTNRNAHYVYFGRPVPARWSSPYYAADERAQMRTANELGTHRVPLLLLTASNITHDGGTAALRAYWLYRYAIENYVPFRRDGYIFAVRRDLVGDARFARFIDRDAPDVSLFEEAFGINDLANIPRAWGASEATLESALGNERRSVHPAESGDGVTRLDAQPGDAERRTLPHFDLLRLRSECATSEGVMRLTWSSRRGNTLSNHALAFVAHSGTLLVPVGARPSWTLADAISDVSLEHANTQCTIRGAEWLTRSRPPATAASGD